MKRLALAAFSVCAFSVALAGQAHANINDIRNSDNAIGVSIGAGSLKYGETDKGKTFDTETGWMPNFGFDAGLLTSATKHPYLNNIYLHMNFTAMTGQTDYHGGVQNSFTKVITALNQTDYSNIYTISGQLGKSFTLSDSFMLTPFADLGWRFWDRTLTGASGYDEYYQNGEAMAGLMVQYSPFAKWVFALSGQAGTTLEPHMSASKQLSPTLMATYGDFNLNSAAVYQFNGKIGYTFSQHLEATASLQYKGFGYGASPKNYLGNSEPSSYTHEITSLLGVAYHLQ